MPPYTPQELDCATCPLKSRLYRRCDKPVGRPPRWTDGTWQSYLEQRERMLAEGPPRCPVLEIERDAPWTVRYVRHVALFEQGVLLRGGGIEEQPHRWWCLMCAAVDELAIVRREEREEATK